MSAWGRLRSFESGRATGLDRLSELTAGSSKGGLPPVLLLDRLLVFVERQASRRSSVYCTSRQPDLHLLMGTCFWVSLELLIT